MQTVWHFEMMPEIFKDADEIKRKLKNNKKDGR